MAVHITKQRTFTAQQPGSSMMIDTKKEFLAEDPELSEDTGGGEVTGEGEAPDGHLHLRES